jgi:lysophospholipase L1-like esterase
MNIGTNRPSPSKMLILLVLVGASAGVVRAAVPMKYNFTNTPLTGYQSITPKSVYNTKQGFGFDFGFDSAVTFTAAQDGIEGKKAVKNPNRASWVGDPFYLPAQQAFFFSVDLPRGNYRVAITLGSKDSAVIATIRAEQRRLMIQDWAIPAGQSATRTIDVNRRSDTIAGTTTMIGITDREKTYIDLDGKLTIEFNGNRPVLQQLEITPIDTETTVYICGNSTVVDQPQEPWGTWGMNFPRFFKSGVAISDQAESGLSSASFISQRRLDNVISTIKAGDYVFVEFGHNDQKLAEADSLTVFRNALNTFATDVIAKKGIIVFVTPTARLSFSGSTVVNTLGSYPSIMRSVASSTPGALLLDLNAMSTTFIGALGSSNAYHAYTHFAAYTVPGQGDTTLSDNTHWNDYGGYELAKAMATAIKTQSASFTFAKYLSDDYVDFNPATPDPYSTATTVGFQLPFSPFMGTFYPPDSVVTTRIAPESYAASGIRIAAVSIRNGVMSLQVAGNQEGLEARVVEVNGALVAERFLHGQAGGETEIQSFHGFANRLHLVELVRDGVIIDERKVIP